jgi:hypothetical protein
MARRIETPWGPAQDSTTIAEGIVSHSTAGHGGIWLDAKHWRRVEELFPGWQSFTGKQWLEEDEDWCIAALAFPEHFTGQDLRAAIRTASHGRRPEYAGRWESIVSWLESDASQPVRDKAAAWTAENAGKWEKGSSGSPPAPHSYPASWCEFIRVGDGKRRSLIIREEYGTWKPIYTDEDLAAITVADLTKAA